MKRLFFTFITCLMLYTGNCMGQADMVSIGGLYNGYGMYLNAEYEHAFKNRISVGADLGYGWERNIFLARSAGDTEPYHQMSFRGFGKYYFLLNKRGPGEGVYGLGAFDPSFYRGGPDQNGTSVRGTYFGAGLGLGFQWRIGAWFLVGGEYAIRKVYFHSYTLEANGTRTFENRLNGLFPWTTLKFGWIIK